jgi:hypothetical protein
MKAKRRISRRLSPPRASRSRASSRGDLSRLTAGDVMRRLVGLVGALALLDVLAGMEGRR